VAPNEGFWRVLCALEGPLGIAQRSDPAAIGGGGGDAGGGGGGGVSAAPADLDASAIGGRVPVRFLTAAEVAAAAKRPPAPAGDRDRDRRRSRSRDRDRDRDRDRRRSRSRSRDRDRRRSSSRDRDRRRSRSRSRERGRPATAAAPPPSSAAAAGGAAAGWTATFDVERDGEAAPLGRLVVGPMRPHQRVSFGRVPSCDVLLEHPSASRLHAALSLDAAGGLLLTDLGSAHGTKLGDVWLKASAPRAVAVGDALRFGASSRIYRLTALAPAV